MNVVYFDTETGGLKPEHPTIQLAAIAVAPDWKEVQTFERKIIFDPSKCDPEALAMNSYRPELWKAAVPERQAVGEFSIFLNAHRSIELVSKRSGRPYTVARLAGHNVVGFDLERVAAMFKRHGAFFPVDFRTVLDTRYGAVWHFERRPGEKKPDDFKLTGLAKHFGISIEGAHDALVDVRLSIALSKRLLEAWPDVALDAPDFASHSDVDLAGKTA